MEAMQAKKWARMVDKKVLGAHYDYIVGELAADHSTQAEDKIQHDTMLAHDGGAQQGKTGFTDRSRRLLEGHGARETLMPSGAKFETLEATSLEDFLHDEQHAAGQLSQHVSYTKQSACGNGGTLERSASGREVNASFNSRKLCSVLDQAATALEQMPAGEEDNFLASMGRKVKPNASGSMKHQGNESEGPVAGDYDKIRSRSEWLQAKTRPARSSSSRTGVAMAIDVMESDPPISSKAVAQSKARGVFADGYSEEAQRHAKEQNPQLLRFASARSRSSSKVQQPQKSSNGAGMPSGAKRRPDSVATPRKSSSSTPRSSTPRSNQSSSMARALDQEASHREARAGRAQRQQQEKSFADICRFTTESRQAQLDTSRAIKSTLGHMQSSGMASQLVWN